MDPSFINVVQFSETYVELFSESAYSGVRDEIRREGMTLGGSEDEESSITIQTERHNQ